MICTDPQCIVQNECIHVRYEDCPAWPVTPHDEER